MKKTTATSRKVAVATPSVRWHRYDYRKPSFDKCLSGCFPKSRFMGTATDVLKLSGGHVLLAQAYKYPSLDVLMRTLQSGLQPATVWDKDLEPSRLKSRRDKQIAVLIEALNKTEDECASILEALANLRPPKDSAEAQGPSTSIPIKAQIRTNDDYARETIVEHELPTPNSPQAFTTNVSPAKFPSEVEAPKILVW